MFAGNTYDLVLLELLRELLFINNVFSFFRKVFFSNIYLVNLFYNFLALPMLSNFVNEDLKCGKDENIYYLLDSSEVI